MKVVSSNSIFLYNDKKDWNKNFRCTLFKDCRFLHRDCWCCQYTFPSLFAFCFVQLLNIWCQFHQHFTLSFNSRRSQKLKKTLMTWLSFALLGSEHVKAVHDHVAKIDLWCQFHQPIDAKHKLALVHWVWHNEFYKQNCALLYQCKYSKKFSPTFTLYAPQHIPKRLPLIYLCKSCSWDWFYRH